MLGKTWNSTRGIRTVVEVSPDGNKIAIKTEGEPFLQILPTHELEAEIILDGKRMDFNRERAELQRKQEAEEVERRYTDGFAEQYSEPQRSRIISTLTRQVSVKNVFRSRRDHGRHLAALDYIVVTSRTGRRVTASDGSFFAEKDLGKTLVDYIAYLTSRNVK